jgi:hypothetical protein
MAPRRRILRKESPAGRDERCSLSDREITNPHSDATPGTSSRTLTSTAAQSIPRQQSRDNSATGQQQVSVLLGQQTTDGNLVVVAFDYKNAEFASITDSQGNTFTLAGSEVTSPGRPFVEMDHGSAAANVAILTSELWTDKFGASPTAVGRTIDIDGVPTTIVGITRAGYRFGDSISVWLPGRR